MDCHEMNNHKFSLFQPRKNMLKSEIGINIFSKCHKKKERKNDKYDDIGSPYDE